MPIDRWKYKEFARKFGIRAKGVVTSYGEGGGGTKREGSFTPTKWGT